MMRRLKLYCHEKSNPGNLNLIELSGRLFICDETILEIIIEKNASNKKSQKSNLIFISTNIMENFKTQENKPTTACN